MTKGKRKFWTPDEDEYLVKWYHIKTAKEIGDYLGRSPQGVVGRARKLELTWTDKARDNPLHKILEGQQRYHENNGIEFHTASEGWGDITHYYLDGKLIELKKGDNI